jgi:transcriptional regulator with XRE-family HTH domain
MNDGFRERLHRVFNHATMAEVARKLKIPHATVRNYYLGRLPATEVLIKIANETGVSLNWLLLGQGEMYGGERPPIGIGQFLEERITELIERKFAGAGGQPVVELGAVDAGNTFDVESALDRSDDPQTVMSQWLRHEGREFPADYGIVFFQGWETFSRDDKVDALHDAKRVLDRALRG